jgi:hypothetical protein
VTLPIPAESALAGAGSPTTTLPTALHVSTPPCRAPPPLYVCPGPLPLIGISHHRLFIAIIVAMTHHLVKAAMLLCARGT